MSNDEEYILCKICDSYLYKNDYEDHIYCHSLDKVLPSSNISPASIK